MPRRKKESIAEDMVEIDNIFKAAEPETLFEKVQKLDNETVEAQNSTNNSDVKKSTTELVVQMQSIIDNNNELTDQEIKFIEVFSMELNKKGAMDTAFPELSDHQKKAWADKLLEKPLLKSKVNEIIQKNLDASVQRSPSVLLKWVERYMDLDIRDYYYSDGSPKPLSEIDDSAALLLEGISKVVNNKSGSESILYTLPSKLKVLDKLESICKLLITARSVVGELHDATQEDAATKRDEIFNSVLNKANEPEEPKKKGRGRPKKYFTKDELAEDVTRV